MRLEFVGVMERTVGCGFIESVLGGNCRPERQSGVAVVMAGTTQPDQFGGERVDLILANRSRLPLHQRVDKRCSGVGASGQARLACD